MRLATHNARVRQPGRGFFIVAFGSFTVANLIHNNFGLDLAIVPAAVLAALNWWRPRRGFVWGGAIFIALPAFWFLKWSSLTNPSRGLPFLNHVALLLAGAFAVLCMAQSVGALLRDRQSAPHADRARP